MSSAYTALLIAIIAETIATSALNASQQFTRLTPSLITVTGYGIAFYCLSVALQQIPVGIVYAIWSGLGIMLISIVGFVVFRQQLDYPAILGIVLIIAGVLTIQLFSHTSPH